MNELIVLLKRRLINISNELELDHISYEMAKYLLINDFMIYDEKIENIKD